MNNQTIFLLKNLPNLLLGFPGHRPGGLLMSILLAMVAIGVGFLLAVIIGTGYKSRFRPLRLLAYAYVQLFRGIPLILLLLIVHQLLGFGRQLGLERTALTSALVTLTLYSSAYQAEIVRAGLQSVPQPMVESARLMGSSQRQTYWLIKIRYTLHVMLPAFTGQAISLFKDTSVVIILGVAELMTVARIALGSEVGNAPYWVSMFLVVGFFYFSVAFSLSRIAQRWEHGHRSGDLVHSLANY
ncbi:MAG: ABC transporter permease subunit [Chloroflexi bacterium]|nr:ABC transporter permease subunit [Chloroflexota bacterium]